MQARTVFLLSFLPMVAVGAVRLTVDDIRVENGELLFSYRIENLTDDATLQVLQRGAASQIVHRVLLWKKKGLINPLRKEITITMHVAYDAWEKKYCILCGEERRLTNSLESVKERCFVVRDLAVCRIDELDDNQVYYFSVEVSYRPIAGESLATVGGLLEDGKKVRGKGGLMNVFINLLGFGDKKVAAKSADFKLMERRAIELMP